MLKGDLAATALPEVLRSLADTAATGCLRVTPDTDERRPEDARLYLRSGQVYAVTLPGRAPRLGARLVASGDLAPSDLAEAAEAQRTELQGWRLGELLVHLGYVEQPVVEAVVADQLRESAADLMLWTAGRWRFRDAERTREDVVTPVAVEDLLAEVAERRAAFEALAPVLHGADGVPVLSAAGTAPESQSLDPQAWTLLCSVDGERSLAELAAAGGFTLYEAGDLVAALVDAGLVEVEAPAVPAEEPVFEEPVAEDAPVVEEAVVEEAVVEEAPADLPVVVELPVEVAVAEEPFAEVPVAEVPEPADEILTELPVDEPPPAPVSIAARLAAALKSLDPDGVGMVPTLMAGEEVDRSLERRVEEDEREQSVDRVSASLATALGEPTGELELFPVTSPRLAPVVPLDVKQAERRARDAQELADRQAEMEAARWGDADAEQAAADAALAQQVAAEQADADSLAESRRSAELQAAAFAELTASASLDSAPEPPVEAVEVAPEPTTAWVDEDPAPLPRPTDTAALLRELSSLGLEDEPPAPSLPQPRASQQAAVATKKRKGLFGR